MDHRIRVASYKRDDWRLLGKVFKSKPIKRGSKISLFKQIKTTLEFKMSSQNNNYAIASTSSNSYISRKLNNMEEARLLKKE